MIFDLELTQGLLLFPLSAACVTEMVHKILVLKQRLCPTAEAVHQRWELDNGE
jgi:hypothetical protein